MKTDNNIIKRKAIDTWGKLGTTYDAPRDRLILANDIRGPKVSTLEKCSICKVFSGDRSTDLVNYLEKMNFNDALRQSLLLRMIKPSGVSSLMDYNQPVNENTRFLYYSYRNKTEELKLTPENAAQIMACSQYFTSETHVITKIQWGIEILCVIQIPNGQSAEIVDNLLQSISKRLENDKDKFILENDERLQIIKLKNITVYDRENYINPCAYFIAFLTGLSVRQKCEIYHYPLVYTMYSLRWIYNDKPVANIVDLTDKINSSNGRIQSIIREVNATRIKLETLLEKCCLKFVNSSLDQQLKDFQTQFSTLLKMYKQFLHDSRETVIKLRQNLCESEEINKVISDQHYSSLTTAFDTLHKTVEQWWTKANLISRLKNDQIQYKEISEIVPQAARLKTLEEINAALILNFSRTNSSVILYYSSNQLKQRNEEEWEKKYQQFIFKKQETKEIPCIYMDFTQCEQVLHDFIIVTLPDKKISTSLAQNPTQQLTSTNTDASNQPLSSMTEINVLLLGETGVGKSTFINAFVNYLIFDTLEQAEQSDPAVVIPVSFITTTGDNFDEITVKFGDVDSNENFQNQGQSVTQHCRSYIIDLNEKVRLRLIDTPGIGDTRGFDQDEINMNNILTYINQLSHINAVCLLLKPTNSKLDVFFRSCVKQLLTYLTPDGYGNIIFCFTNSRSTFYAPGNTGSLLKKMLKKDEFNGIPFEKKNTFCVDSETFRYLAARRCNVEFQDYIKVESIDSWKTSVAESARMLKFIQTLQSYHLNKYGSLRKALLDVSMLARPLMEKLRLVLYNWKLVENKLEQKEIIIKSNFVNIEICSNCAKCTRKTFGQFHMVEYDSVKSENVASCHCPSDENHFLIEYTVKYLFTLQRIKETSDQLSNSFHKFLWECDRLTHFLQQNGLINKNDPFSCVLRRFIDEAQHIRDASRNMFNINNEIYNMLSRLPELRKNNSKELIQRKEKLKLDEIHGVIDKFMLIPEVKQQIECIKKSRQLLMAATEQQVKTPSTKNKNFAVLTI